MITVKVVNKGNQPLPEYSTPQSAGMDLRANIDEPIELHSMERVLVKTGLHIQLPDGMVALVCPRSGLALKQGITVLNAPGVVDGDFVGDIGVILINLSNSMFRINPGDRIAQLVFSWHCKVDFQIVESLEKTERGEGGFGHTGVK